MKISDIKRVTYNTLSGKESLIATDDNNVYNGQSIRVSLDEIRKYINKVILSPISSLDLDNINIRDLQELYTKLYGSQTIEKRYIIHYNESLPATENSILLLPNSKYRIEITSPDFPEGFFPEPSSENSNKIVINRDSNSIYETITVTENSENIKLIPNATISFDIKTDSNPETVTIQSCSMLPVDGLQEVTGELIIDIIKINNEGIYQQLQDELGQQITE